MNKWYDSSEDKIYFKNLKQVIQEKRLERFENWLKCNDFDKLMYRLILEHNNNYRDKYYHNGKMPFPNNKLSFLLEYIYDKTEPIEVLLLENNFDNQINLFNGYYFQQIFGQGVITNIYNKEDLRLVLQI